jgi:outer membrane immunogenic protein
MKKFAVSLLAIAALTGAGYAADAPEFEEPVMVDEGWDWNGFYVGVHGGWGRGVIESEYDTGGGFTPQVDYSVEGWLLGGQAGALFQADMFVFGIEGRAAWTNITGDDGGDEGVTDTFTGRWSAAALVSAGLALDRVLPYVTAGVSALNYDYMLSQIGVPANNITTNATTWGPTVGAGVRLGLAENVHIFGEWNRTWYQTQTLTFPGTGFSLAQDINVTPTVDTFLAGINVSFD